MLELDKIYNMDCIEGLQKLDNETIDLVVTSPPYFNSAHKYQRGTGIHYSIDVGEPLYTIVDASKELLKVLKQDGFYCLNLGFSYGETGVMRPFYIVQQLLKQGWFAIDTIIWHKTNPIPIKDRLTNSFEYVFVLAKHPSTKYPNDIGYKHNFFECSIAKSEGCQSAPFPEMLPKFCIEIFSKEGDLICDIFNGSGTTTKIAKQLKRHYLGFEINPEYVKIANKRLKNVPVRLDKFQKEGENQIIKIKN